MTTGLCSEGIQTFYSSRRRYVLYFQVFKLHVHKGRHDNWFVFRRYTDFLQLQKKVCVIFSGVLVTHT